jgi:hypothetical protein
VCQRRSSATGRTTAHGARRSFATVRRYWFCPSSAADRPVAFERNSYV